MFSKGQLKYSFLEIPTHKIGIFNDYRDHLLLAILNNDLNSINNLSVVEMFITEYSSFILYELLLNYNDFMTAHREDLIDQINSIYSEYLSISILNADPNVVVDSSSVESLQTDFNKLVNNFIKLEFINRTTELYNESKVLNSALRNMLDTYLTSNVLNYRTIKILECFLLILKAPGNYSWVAK